MEKVTLKHVAPTDLRPAVYNPRKIGDTERAALLRGVAEFGVIDPIVARAEDLMVLGGHQRLSVAIELGLATVPVALVEGLSDDRAAAVNVLLNNPKAQGAWDMKALSDVLSELDAHGFDATLTGFDEGELEGILAWTPDPDKAGEEDANVDLTPPVEPISNPGEVYQLGRHRLMCGDATRFDHVERLIAGASVGMCYTDPPYGIKIVSSKGHIGASNLAQVGSYAPVIGDDSTQTAVDAFNLVSALSIPVVIFWGANYYAESLPPSSCWIVWDKENGDNNFADCELAWTNQRSAVRIFRHMWQGMIKASERGEKRVHPTQKPVALAEWCFDKFGSARDVILDLFGGSGSTLVAAERMGRTSLIMEMSPAYCDVIRNRYAALVGDTEAAA